MAEPRNIKVFVLKNPAVKINCVPGYYPIQALRNEALWRTRNNDLAPAEWEVYDEVGGLVAPETKVSELKYGLNLWLRLKEGARTGGMRGRD